VIHPNAAGIDVGNSANYVAVRPDRNPDPVRRFDCFTADLHGLADWLQQCGVTTVAPQSTGVYWLPLYDILDARGLEVYLVNHPILATDGRHRVVWCHNGPVRVVGTRHSDSLPMADQAALARTTALLRGTAHLVPRGVYRFSSFDEADAWMTQMLLRTHAHPNRKTSSTSVAP
jgi:hypothetical protein